MSCISTECPRYPFCAKAVSKSELESAVPYASCGVGDSNGYSKFMCGPAGDFKEFVPIPMSVFLAERGIQRYYLVFSSSLTIDDLLKPTAENLPIKRFMKGYFVKADFVPVHNDKLFLDFNALHFGLINLSSFDFITSLEVPLVFLSHTLPADYDSTGYPGNILPQD